MALSDADFAGLAKFKTGGFPPGQPPNIMTFFSPVDDVHSVLMALHNSVAKSLYEAMYGYDDDEIAQSVHDKLDNSDIFVQLSLDSSQAGGKHEKAILAKQDYPANSLSIGRSERGAIQHLKMGVIDGVDRYSGSTNQSEGGEQKQDNELTVIRNAVVAHDAIVRMSKLHDNQLMQMAKKAKEAA